MSKEVVTSTNQKSKSGIKSSSEKTAPSIHQKIDSKAKTPGEKTTAGSLKPAWLHLPTWECQFEDVKEFTVGDKKKLVCHGDYTAKLKEPIRILAINKKTGQDKGLIIDKKLDYILHPLELISAENESATLLVTSYVSGKFENLSFLVVRSPELSLYLGSGVPEKLGNSNSLKNSESLGNLALPPHGVLTSGFQIKPLSWEVQSVIENPQMPQGFGPSGPLYLNMPWWFWGGWTFAIVLVGIVIGYKFIRVFERKRLVESLATHNTSLSPYNQYHREMRQLTREYQSANYMRKVQGEGSAGEYLLELDRVLRLYLVRQLQVPALSWGTRQIVGEIKHRHKLVFKGVGLEIQQTLREFEKAVKSQKEVGMVDCNQFNQMSRHVVEQVHKGIVK